MASELTDSETALEQERIRDAAPIMFEVLEFIQAWLRENDQTWSPFKDGEIRGAKNWVTNAFGWRVNDALEIARRGKDRGKR